MTTSSDQGPIADFSEAHAGILARFERLRELPRMLADPAGAETARKFADEMVRFFRHAVFEHHAEEEEALFPAVVRSAEPGDEKELTRSLVSQLTREHRSLEAQWAKLEPAMKQLARGKPADLDLAAVERLAIEYTGHARFEESVWLPLSAKILSGNDQAALGLTLHMRHALDKVVAHI